MSPRAKFVGTVLAFVFILIATLSALYLKRRSDDLTEQFRERSLWRAQVFAGLAPGHLDRDDWHELFSTIFTAPDVLYAQVVYRGQVRAARGSIPVLPLAREDILSYAPKLSEARAPAGQAYLDIFYPLIGESSSPDSYVRLGLSLNPVEQELRSEVLTITLIALVAVALAAVLTIWLAQALFPERSPAASPAPLAPPLKGEGNSPSPSFPLPLEGEGGDRPVAPTEVRAEKPALVVDNAGKRVFLNGTEVKLSPKEYELVRLLASEPGRVFSNEEILQAVWTGRHWATAQDVKQYIYFVRKKLEADPENPQFIVTVRGFGYKLKLD
jgi:hypothetical protein